MIILGPLFPEEREQEIISASKRGVSNAANNFQWNLIKGIYVNTDEPLIVINALPVGTWPKNFKILHLKDTDWSCGSIVGHEVGCWNIPLVKQFIRMRKVRAWLKKYPCESEILIFTAYVTIRQEQNGNTIAVTFETKSGEETYELFKVLIGDDSSEVVGSLTDDTGTQRNVYLHVEELPADSGLEETEQTRFYAMQEDLNYLIDNLK